MEYIIGVDIGGTQIRAVLADTAGNIISETHALTESQHGPYAVIDRAVEYIQRFQRSLPINARLLGVGVGCPGPLDPDTGVVFTTPNLPNWHNIPIKEVIEQKTGLQVKIANDANAAALGEWYFGGGKGYKNMVYVTISTGIGGGVITDGKLLLGRLGGGGEIGHMVIDTQEQKTWEKLASGTALKRIAKEQMQQNPHTLLHEITNIEQITAADVAAAAKQGDELAQQLMKQESFFLGIGFANLLHLYSPDIILVGGSVVTANPTLLDHARSVVQEHVIADIYTHVPIEVAHLGNRVGLLGAVALILEYC